MTGSKEIGKLIIIVAPSGAGKTTLIKRLRQDFPNLNWSISCTTRPARQGEVDGESYFFLSEQDFLQKRDQGEFVEWAQVHAHYYGTLRSYVNAVLEQGGLTLFDVDVQGADALKKNYPRQSLAFFIAPPSLEVLEQRLRKRGTDSDEVIQRRLTNAKHELTRQHDYDFLIVNENLEQAYQKLFHQLQEIQS